MIARALLLEAPGIGHQPVLEPSDIAAAPELAILEAADDVLDTAVAALLAANPELADDPFEPSWDRHEPSSPRLYAADALFTLSHALRCAIDRYRCAVRASLARPR